MVSVIIPTLNAEKQLESLLLMLREQSISPEILIIDSSSTDNTKRIAKRMNIKVITIDKADFNHGKARNTAARESNNEILIFITQDSVPLDRQCLERLIAPLQRPQIVASFARQVPKSDASPVEQFSRYFNYPDKPMLKGLEALPSFGIKTFFFSNVCSAIKSKEFNELERFPENIIMFEDLIFAAKAIMKGYKIAYVPDARVWHSHNFSLLQQFCRYQDAGISLRNNSWVFEQAKTNREGVEFLKQQIDYLYKTHQNKWIPYAIAESIFKFSGFWLGLHGINPRKKMITIASVPSNNA